MHAQGLRVTEGLGNGPGVAPSINRAAGLERLRIMATLLVVWLHATIAYLAYPLPGLAWPVHEASNSWLVNLSFWFVQCSIMPLFFVLSGIAAAHLWGKKSGIEFLKHRMFRLGGPLVVGTLLVLPFDIYIWAIGWVMTGRYEPVKLKSLKFSDADAQMFFGFGHLWYLVYLLLISAVACGVLMGRKKLQDWWTRGRVDQGILRMTGSKASISLQIMVAVLGFVLAVGFFWLSPRMTLGFKHGFEPHVTHVVYYALFFAAGWWMTSSQISWSRPVMFAGLSVLCFAIAYPVSQTYMASNEADQAAFVWCAVLIPMTACLTTVASIGWAMKSSRELFARETYYSQMSLWVYLAHHPVIGLSQTLLYGWGLPSELKAIVAASVSLSFCVWSYQFVRRGRIALWLYGREMPSLAELRMREEQPVDVEVRRAA